MTKELQDWYEAEIINAAYGEVRRILSYNDLFKPILRGDTRAEELVAAITKYYKEGLND